MGKTYFMSSFYQKRERAMAEMSEEEKGTQLLGDKGGIVRSHLATLNELGSRDLKFLSGRL